MEADGVALVAGWLASQKATLLPLIALGTLVRAVPGSRRDAARAVLAALDQLDAAGLIRFAHLFPMPVVGVLDRDGLRQVSATAGTAATAVRREP